MADAAGVASGVGQGGGDGGGTVRQVSQIASRNGDAPTAIRQHQPVIGQAVDGDFHHHWLTAVVDRCGTGDLQRLLAFGDVDDVITADGVDGQHRHG
ncbi:hypothetical protein D3C80_1579490 [compost metagenome]